ncbi:MAG: 3-dehydroquinate synthase [Candidatus Omnitrophica bacterium]|nr:3-dehydroquinate synthase [Candidatus Omnitrophota bacterium]
MIQTISVPIASHRYSIYVGKGAVNRLPRLLRSWNVRGNLFVVSQAKILRLHGAKLKKILSSLHLPVYFHVIPDRESSKSQRELFRLYEAMLRAKLDRSSTVLALGGGVVGDLTGFAASTFKRGVGLVHIPTTLLAQVDSSIGGKTAINLEAGKNLVGSFYHPKAVIADTEFLKTLPREKISDSLAEVIKYGMMKKEFFSWLKGNLSGALKKDIAILEKIVLESARIKAKVVTVDPDESRGYRDILNYGHTFAHGFEAAAGYKKQLTHGKAVACGMIAACDLALRLGLTTPETARQQLQLIRCCGLPVSLRSFGFTPQQIFRYFLVDKKARDGKIKFILPQRIGKLLAVKGIRPSLVRETLQQIL